MKIEYKLVVRKSGTDKMEVLEWNESKAQLDYKAELLQEQHPNWQILVVKENYNVS